MQKGWCRTRLARCRFLKAMKHHRHLARCATRIQCLYRGHTKRLELARRRAASIARWGELYVRYYKVLYRSRKAFRIQRCYRRHIRARVEARAAVHIQRIYRGHRARVLRALLLFRK